MFHLVPRGDRVIVAVPFSGKSSCKGADGGVQLIQLSGDDLSKRALLPISGNPRRAIRRDGELLAVSDSHVSSFSLASLDVASRTAQVQIGVCTQRAYAGAPLGGWEGDDYHHCAITSRSVTARIVWPAGIFLGLGGFLVSRRRRRAA